MQVGQALYVPENGHRRGGLAVGVLREGAGEVLAHVGYDLGHCAGLEAEVDVIGTAAFPIALGDIVKDALAQRRPLQPERHSYDAQLAQEAVCKEGLGHRLQLRLGLRVVVGGDQDGRARRQVLYVLVDGPHRRAGGNRLGEPEADGQHERDGHAEEDPAAVKLS